ncbi:MAG: LCP family protein [Oscillospiraceae bacterium]|nr:LCP family protein [Oscillospiraceae bacterium]
MKLIGSSGKSKHSGGHSEPQETETVTDKKLFADGTDAAPKIITEQIDSAEPEQPEGKPKKRKKLSTKKKLLIAAACVAAVIIAAVAAYCIWETPPTTVSESPKVQSTMRPASVSDDDDDADVTEDDDTQQEETESVRKDDCYTFMIAAFDQLGANTDTILVGRMDVAEGTLNIVSVPRDTLVDVPWSVKKINSVMAYYGNDPEALIAELSDIMGFSVDCYAVVDITAIEKLIDCIGGVYYTVPINMDYDDPTQNLHIHISKGYQWLSGSQAVQVLRFREGNNGSGYATGDLGRIQTQQDFLMSVASQMLSVGNIPNLSSAIDIFTEYVDTNLTAANIAYFAREFLLMDADNITFSTMPGEAVYTLGASYYSINTEEWLEVINESLSPFTLEITESNLNILTASSTYSYSSSSSGSTSTATTTTTDTTTTDAAEADDETAESGEDTSGESETADAETDDGAEAPTVTDDVLNTDSAVSADGDSGADTSSETTALAEE